MKVLFVSSGNSKVGISPIVKNQGESLINKNIDLTFFTIKGKGFKGYLKNIIPLRKLIKKKKFDIVHAHYSMSAFVAILAGAKNLVISFMGDDLLGSQKHDSTYTIKGKLQVILSYLISKIATYNIVKSIEMSKKLNKFEIIPNGVNFNKFRPILKDKAIDKLGFDNSINYVLFPANKNRPEKNYSLFIKAKDLLNQPNIEILSFDNTSNEIVPFYFNASTLIVLTSYHEGSPNVIKEAMACNIPIVSTDVGDVEEVIGNTEGCYITTFEPEDVADKIKMALEFAKTKGRTKGRERLVELGLDSETVAKKIISIYEKVLKN